MKLSFSKTPDKPEHPEHPEHPDKPCNPIKVFVWVYRLLRREPIETKGPVSMTLEPIPYGYQDIYEGVGDEDFENPKIINKVGDGEQRVEKTGPKKLQLIVMGNGSVGGSNTFSVQVDGHIGSGEVPITSDFDYEVTSTDATEVKYAKTGREKIPL